MATELKDLTKRADNYSQWYNDLVIKADLAEQSRYERMHGHQALRLCHLGKMQRELDRMFKEIRLYRTPTSLC